MVDQAAVEPGLRIVRIAPKNLLIGLEGGVVVALGVMLLAARQKPHDRQFGNRLRHGLVRPFGIRPIDVRFAARGLGHVVLERLLGLRSQGAVRRAGIEAQFPELLLRDLQALCLGEALRARSGLGLIAR
jgi:hypothetical protein